jgi:hypothetical protein
MLELKNPQPQDINFWVTGDTFPNFDYLVCDLVFVVAERTTWQDKNSIERSDPIVDSDFAFRDHYRWVTRQHRWASAKRPRISRITLKADPIKSFQPQTESGVLIDILPVLVNLGLSKECLRRGLSKKSFGAKPMPISHAHAYHLHDWFSAHVSRKLGGALLRRIREEHPELESPW